MKGVQEGHGSRARSLVAIGLIICLLVLVADQASKYWIVSLFHLPDKGSVPILSWLNFTMVWNHAVTFGMLGGLGRFAPFIFSAIALAAVLFLFSVIITTRRLCVAIAAGMIAGGAVGNVVDRLRIGAVVDFIHLHAYGYDWFVFNVADMAIDCGVALWIFDRLLLDPQK